MSLVLLTDVPERVCVEADLVSKGLAVAPDGTATLLGAPTPDGGFRLEVVLPAYVPTAELTARPA